MANFTEREIKNVFLRLLDEKPLSQITVKQIAEECGINRNSFYYHFDDIPSLIEKIVTEEADRIISEYPDIDSVDTAVRVVIEFASENRRAIMHIYNSVNRDIFERYLWKICDYVVENYGAKAFSDSGLSEIDREVITRFYSCEFFGFGIRWMEDRLNEDVQTYIDRFCALYRGLPEMMIVRAKEK